jgi:hypothetical protein
VTDESVPRVGYGGGGPRLSTPSSLHPLPHDIIRFFPITKDRTFEVCAPLYEAGWSLREIEEKTGIAKTSIRATLTSQGLTMRHRTKKPADKETPVVRMRSSIQPFGYAWLEGKLVKDPAEYKTVLKILALWQVGKDFRAIAKLLNNQKIPTRFGGSWHHNTINQIVKRQSSMTE